MATLKAPQQVNTLLDRQGCLAIWTPFLLSYDLIQESFDMQGRPGSPPWPQTSGNGISKAEEVPDAAAALIATLRNNDAGQVRPSTLCAWSA